MEGGGHLEDKVGRGGRGRKVGGRDRKVGGRGMKVGGKKTISCSFLDPPRKTKPLFF